MSDGKGSYGYNAASGEFGDMLEMGILDPTKVTRTALQNAASIARLMITTEAMIGDAPDKDKGGSGGGHDGGMRSEEHTSELQSLMRTSYAVFCLKKQLNNQQHLTNISHTYTATC